MNNKHLKSKISEIFQKMREKKSSKFILKNPPNPRWLQIEDEKMGKWDKCKKKLDTKLGQELYATFWVFAVSSRDFKGKYNCL